MSAASGWCHWHHAPADTLALIAIAPATSGTEFPTTFGLVPAVAATESGGRAPESRLATPAAGDDHDFPIEGKTGAHCPEHGIEIQRLPQPLRLLQALAEELRAAGDTHG
ncbi:hypothetical protein [Streptomyces sp. 8L]|uniref:hypothetical protein n=1 Tax=Streptomyces sp. 8L TaxID=2877242 RepID=UPI001CD569B1|nr:hypothetical protein [Streptomyces sp. 8L]MCA1223292.1 hypothetical protein [Streptomyces sp. 8L]